VPTDAIRMLMRTFYRALRFNFDETVKQLTASWVRADEDSDWSDELRVHVEVGCVLDFGGRVR